MLAPGAVSVSLEQVDLARKALVKAIKLAQAHNLCQSTLTATAVAAEILTHYRIPFVPAAGYIVLEGDVTAVPHTWLISCNLPTRDPENPVLDYAVTDLTVGDFQGLPEAKYMRAVPVLGQNVNFAVSTILGFYYEGEELPEGCKLVSLASGLPAHMNIVNLRVLVGDLSRFLAGGPKYVRDAVETVVSTAIATASEPLTTTVPAPASAGAPPGAMITVPAKVHLTTEKLLKRPPAVLAALTGKGVPT